MQSAPRPMGQLQMKLDPAQTPGEGGNNCFPAGGRGWGGEDASLGQQSSSLPGQGVPGCLLITQRVLKPGCLLIM